MTARASVPPPRGTPSDRPPPGGRSHLQLSTTAGGGDAHPALAPDPLIGLVVAERYRILDLLGRGGMGVVYRVEHVRIGKLLAMKLLAGELSRNPEAVRRFKHEAQTASRLSSPNTVQVFDFGAADGLTYLVMELVGGEDLGTLLRLEEVVEPRRLCRIVLQVANALAEAHQHGIVHRDVKPENVMLVRGKEGHEIAKVFDFGLAKLREGLVEGPAMTTPGLIMGTPYFMAPEQVRGEVVDHRADIYALGAVMYRSLTGRYPFDGASPIAVCAKHLTEEAIPPAQVAPERGIPVALSDVVMRALAKDPDARHARVEDLQAAVADVLATLEGHPVEPFDSAAIRAMTAAGPGVVEHGADPAAVATRDEVEAYERRLRRRRWGVLAAAALIPIAAAAAGAAWWSRPAEAFDGWEREPNDEAATATPVPYGMTVHAHLGRRASPTRSDVDLFAFDVPAGGPSRIELAALPNIPLCLQLFRKGQPSAFAQWCSGQPGVDLVLPQVALEPGPHLAAVLQDVDPRGSDARVFVHENVSDAFALTVRPADVAPDHEIEPNDVVGAASRVAIGGTMHGAIASAADEDVVCVDDAEDRAIRLVITDAARPDGVVLEVTPRVDGAAQPLRRVHGRAPRAPAPDPPRGAAGRAAPAAAGSDIDVPSPFTLALPAAAARCLTLRLGVDPARPEAASAAKVGSAEPWSVRVEAADAP